ncbi:S41 family peptidase [Clostridium cochlearium]|uniref:Peptidase S41 n=1 Tax=Clostridium cochlearium TaxID=1494 RepID=A0A7Y3V7W8_CLOCO|nr:S41 family peptidase [Clostridium cochlearium]NOH16111.1 peptidase S41 [Clostridium cochlearium]
MKKWNVLIMSILCIVCILFSGCKSKYAADPENRDEKWIKDIEYLSRQLPKKHKNLFFTLKEEEFNKEIEKLKGLVPKINDNEVKVGIYKILASVKDGHTSGYLDCGKIYPINLYWFKEGIYVINTISEYKSIMNCKLVKINGKSIDEVRKEVAKTISYENDAQLKNMIPRFITKPDILNGLKIIDNTEKVTFTFEDSQNKIVNVDIKEIKYNDINKNLVIDNYNDKNTPLYMKNKNKEYWFEYLQDKNTLYFKYNSCMEMKDKPFKEFSKELLEVLDKNNVKKLIIDMRDNGGGNSSILEPFIKEVKKRDINNKERLFVIVGRRTFSSAILNSIDFKNETNATFIGEPTGGKPNHYGEVKFIKLPNTEMEVSYSTKYFTSSKEDTPSFMPDKIIEPSISDFLNKKDSIMENIIKLER